MGKDAPKFDCASIRCAIGLDVGGTKVAGGVITSEGQILCQETIPTLPARGGEAVADDVYQLAERLMRKAGGVASHPSAIGISICELVNVAGEIVSAETIQWSGLDIGRRFSRLAPTVIEADCRAAALCEGRCGAAREWPGFLYVTIGTGISCTLMIEGRPYAGARGLTGTMASGPLTTLCSECGSLSTTVLERIASGPAISERYNELADASVLCSEAVLAAAGAGDAAARDVLSTACENLGSVIGLLVNVLDPHAVVIGGGLGSAPGIFFEALDTAIRRRIWSPEHRQLPIVRAKYRGLSGLAGAGIIALERR